MAFWYAGILLWWCRENGEFFRYSVPIIRMLLSIFVFLWETEGGSYLFEDDPTPSYRSRHHIFLLIIETTQNVRSSFSLLHTNGLHQMVCNKILVSFMNSNDRQFFRGFNLSVLPTIFRFEMLCCVSILYFLLQELARLTLLFSRQTNGVIT